ncbi:50S ribosomal protein L3 [Candidatus Woesearchaeota archaeon]|nr:50S ribosomal protein L3 [Candidatus Woesearchaeota archaeon]
MAKRNNPRHGSMQFWPRKRAARIYPRVRSYPVSNKTKLLGFAGYKVGMLQVNIRDNTNSVTKGQVISVPATVIECPPLKPLSLRYYEQTDYGLKIIAEIPTQNKLEKELERKIKIPKKNNTKIVPDKFDLVTLQVYTQPKLTSIKKKPEIFEIKISNPNQDFLKNVLVKDIKAEDVFDEGQVVDAHAVTKGYGFQGPVRRFGISLRKKKSEKVKRGPGSLGSWNQQQHIMYRVAHAGQTGYHTRTDYNKLLLKMSSDPKEINPAGGFNDYGFIRSNYLLLKGSVSGARKRLVRLQQPIRNKNNKQVAIEIQ